MRMQEENPFYQRYRCKLPANGRYPAQDTTIFFNRDNDKKIRDLEVVFKPSYAAGPAHDPEIWNRYATYNQKWESELSIGDFDQSDFISSDGLQEFASQIEIERALEEFSHVDECGWARKIIKKFRGERQP